MTTGGFDAEGDGRGDGDDGGNGRAGGGRLGAGLMSDDQRAGLKKVWCAVFPYQHTE